MRYLEWVADRLAKAPVGHVTSGGGPLVLIVGAALVVAFAWAMHRRWRPPRPVIVLAVAVFPLIVWSSALGVGPPSALVVRFFDVGQGDAALVTSPAGVVVLVDGGPDEEQVVDRARGARRQAPGRHGRDASARRPHHRAAERPRPRPGRTGAGAGLSRDVGDPDRPGHGDRRRARAGPLSARRRLHHRRRHPPGRVVARPLLGGHELGRQQRLAGDPAAPRRGLVPDGRRTGGAGAATAPGRTRAAARRRC